MDGLEKSVKDKYLKCQLFRFKNSYLYKGKKHGETNDAQDPSRRNDRRRREKENQRSMAGTIRRNK
ncbi:hypothetical protein EROP_13030 [Erysipelotrichaceae bacterium OPF54]|nr:hypothetical protein EROP_13030 [Erysipelotrichaceae bacterium OPF54]